MTSLVVCALCFVAGGAVVWIYKAAIQSRANQVETDLQKFTGKK